eukprot:3358271-Pyramimonas_sp.AAC.2
MTRKSQIFRYQGLLNGSEPVESTLHTALEEHMNSEMVLGTITDLPSAIAWLKMSYLYVTTCFHMLVPQHFDMQPGTLQLVVYMVFVCGFGYLPCHQINGVCVCVCVCLVLRYVRMRRAPQHYGLAARLTPLELDAAVKSMVLRSLKSLAAGI